MHVWLTNKNTEIMWYIVEQQLGTTWSLLLLINALAIHMSKVMSLFWPKTSADLLFAENHASSPNCPFISLLKTLSFGNPHTAEIICGSVFRCTFGSAALDKFEMPFQIARDNNLPVNHSECIISVWLCRFYSWFTLCERSFLLYHHLTLNTHRIDQFLQMNDLSHTSMGISCVQQGRYHKHEARTTHFAPLPYNDKY